MDDCISWIALRSVPQIGNVAFRRLIDHFGSPDKVLRAKTKELLSVKGIGPAIADSIGTHDCRRDAERELRLAKQQGARVITLQSDEYPALLREIPDAPPYIYVKGNLSRLGRAIAVVGSRNASAYGLMATERLARDLAANGITVASGMARGVDTAAHKGALNAEGFTVGVLGCGIDISYPIENRLLFHQMAEKGALISEFPMATPPLAENFPRRNRIISGISAGVLVVEATEKSGSLITADYALEQGREVFAIPGNINFRSSRGTNRLIKQGAKLVEGVEDILEEFPESNPKNVGAEEQQSSFPGTEGVIAGLLASGPLHIDEIIVKSALTVGDVSAILLRLELKGAVRQLPGKIFAMA